MVEACPLGFGGNTIEIRRWTTSAHYNLVILGAQTSDPSIVKGMINA